MDICIDNNNLIDKKDKNLEKNTDKIFDRLPININTSKKINNLEFQKMVFLYNALENGWQISKNYEKYIFIKKHEAKKEVLSESYLQDFINKNMDISKMI